MFQSFKGAPPFLMALFMATLFLIPSAVADDFGEPVSGLSFSLATSHSKIKNNEKAQLKMELRNDGDSDLILCLHYFGPHYLSIEVTDPSGHVEIFKFQTRITASIRPLEFEYPNLKPNEIFPMDTTGKLGKNTIGILGSQISFPANHWRQNHSSKRIDPLQKGIYKLRAIYDTSFWPSCIQNDDQTTCNEDGLGINPFNKRKCWYGKVFSNSLSIEVLD